MRIRDIVIFAVVLLMFNWLLWDIMQEPVGNNPVHVRYLEI